VGRSLIARALVLAENVFRCTLPDNPTGARMTFAPKAMMGCLTGGGVMKRNRTIPSLLFLMCLIAVMPYAWGQVGVKDANLEPFASFEGAKIDALKVGVSLCHIPQGNPANAQTIVVGQAAVAAHLAHGDYLGECATACTGVTCTAQDDCHDVGTCDPATGACSNPPATNGTACDDGNPATTGDQCTDGVCGGTVACAGAPSAVPKTGQTACWDESGAPVECAGTGQDGEYQTGVSVDPRFTDNADGTVTDNLTGLIWLKNANCFGYQFWTTALSDANTLAAGSCGLTDGSVAGAWRLPNVKELESLIDLGQINPALPVGHPFSGVQSNNYWSSTTSASSPSIAWHVYLYNGIVSIDNKTGGHPVWPVRGGQ
jgi:hypothetical protein